MENLQNGKLLEVLKIIKGEKDVRVNEADKSCRFGVCVERGFRTSITD